MNKHYIHPSIHPSIHLSVRPSIVHASSSFVHPFIRSFIHGLSCAVQRLIGIDVSYDALGVLPGVSTDKHYCCKPMM